MIRSRSLAPAGLLALAGVLCGSPARAWEPEFNLAFEGGGGFPIADDGAVGDGLGWFALHADATLFRSLSREVGLSFVFRVGSRHFRDALLTGGMGAVLPVHEALPLVIEIGSGFDAVDPEGLFYARLWWGARSHNMGSEYSGAYGLFAEYLRPFVPGDDPPTLIFGASIDAFTLLWPVLWLYQWMVAEDTPMIV